MAELGLEANTCVEASRMGGGANFLSIVRSTRGFDLTHNMLMARSLIVAIGAVLLGYRGCASPKTYRRAALPRETPHFRDVLVQIGPAANCALFRIVQKVAIIALKGSDLVADSSKNRPGKEKC